jgi:hypothetical protein
MHSLYCLHFRHCSSPYALCDFARWRLVAFCSSTFRFHCGMVWAFHDQKPGFLADRSLVLGRLGLCGDCIDHSGQQSPARCRIRGSLQRIVHLGRCFLFVLNPNKNALVCVRPICYSFAMPVSRKNTKVPSVDLGSPQAVEQFREAARVFTRNIVGSSNPKRLARALMVREGLLTEGGNLTSRYK